MGYACAMIVHTDAIQVLPGLLLDQFDTFPSQWRQTLNTYMKEFCSNQIIIVKIVAMRTLTIFLDCIE